MFDDPAEHLELNQQGVLAAKNGSPHGFASIELFALNERDLPDERARAYRDAARLFKDVVMARLDNNTSRLAELEPELEEIRSGARPYAMAARLAVEDMRGRLGLNLPG